VTDPAARRSTKRAGAPPEVNSRQLAAVLTAIARFCGWLTGRWSSDRRRAILLGSSAFRRVHALLNTIP
jgi:hypothetical protein